MTVLSTTITGSYAPGITANPFIITATGEITAASGYALSLTAATSWYVLNQGLITASAAGAYAVELTNGTIINSGSISGSNGVQIAGTAAVTNSGFISAITGSGGGAVYLDNQSNGQVGDYGGFGVLDNNAAATIVNAGTILGASRGIYANQGLTLTNSGTIASNFWGIRARQGGADGIAITNEAGGTIDGGSIGIYFGGASDGTLVNAGTIKGSDDAVRANYAGITIDVVVDPGAVFEGSVLGGAYDKLDFASGASAGTFSGLGTQYTGFGSYTVDAGASWTAAGSNTVVAGQTLSDAGHLSGTGDFTNAGLITVGSTNGIEQDAGTFVNNASISVGLDTLAGVYAYGTAFVSNAVGATITGGRYNGVALFDHATLVNAGLISGGKLGGAYAGAYAVVSNLATGTLVGTGYGFYGDGVTLFNAGSIEAGAYQDAVTFAAASGNRLVVYPGAYFLGTVDGGNPITASTLEFASGTGAGTFSGLGSQYINFGQVSIDAGATWTAASVNSIVAGQTLTNNGSLYSVGAFTNSGYISAAHNAVTLSAGTFTNDGLINAGTYAVRGNDSTGTLINSGTILGSGAFGAVYLKYGGAVDNLQGGTIAGFSQDAIQFSGSSLVNDGYVTGALYGIYFFHGGLITNQAQGTIASGSFAVAGYGTLTNAGTLVGEYAVRIGQDGYASRLIVDPGAVFMGTIDGSNTIGAAATSVLEFAAGSGTLAGFGTTVFDFAQITLDPGAQWFLSGTEYGFGGGETISGFAPGNTLELTGTTVAYSAFAGGILTLSDGTTLDLPDASNLKVTNDGTNTFITACFASDTKIAGEFGPVPVEALRVGDLVRTARGRLAPVRWLGFRRTDLARHPRPLDVMPVRVHAGAFGKGLPTRDLVLSPDHAVFVRGRLIPIRYLINNVSIVQESRTSITYWHVELDQHDVIFAEDLPCESYLDTGNRSAFANAPDAVQMTPDFARGIWATQGCAPIVTDPADPTLRLLHTKLMARARGVGRAA